MSKAAMISIQPKWCELIASGKKTIEVRKTAPKIDAPFKCYIYCTASDVHSCLMVGGGGAKLIRCCNYKTAIPVGGEIGNGKVIGEFVCDRIDKIKNQDSCFMIGDNIALTNRIARESCLDYDDIRAYLGDKDGYAWHISNLIIYDTPKELGEIRKPCDYGYQCKHCDKSTYKTTYLDATTQSSGYVPCNRSIARPPQSWRYVEEV